MRNLGAGARRLPAAVLTLVLAMAGLTFLAPQAQAFSQAAYPVVAQGNRGVDVQSLQLLLAARGYSPGTSDGVFGQGTKDKVVAFQKARGLGADGIVGSATWGALVVTVKSGASGPAVKAVQVQLNKKRHSGLTVDGIFGGGTDSAVKTFQSHAAITADGDVGATTWRNLLWHFALPSWTNLCDQNPDGNASANWGTGSAIGQLEAASASFAGTGQGRLPVGDISYEHGGEIPDHASHELGVDVDVWPIRTDSAQCSASRITWQSSTYDRAATRQLVKAIRATGRVSLVYFNDPTLINEGLTTQYPNHDNHLHIRYR